MSKPWERCDRETAVAFEAFAAYRDLGPARSLAKVGDKLGKSEALMERWSGRHEWVTRAQAWDDHLDRQATSGQAKAVREMNERQAAVGVRLQAKAVEGLQQLPAKMLSAGDVTKLADTGAKLERLARGEATERQGAAGTDAQNLALDPELADAAHEFLHRVAERRMGEAK